MRINRPFSVPVAVRQLFDRRGRLVLGALLVATCAEIGTCEDLSAQVVNPQLLITVELQLEAMPTVNIAELSIVAVKEVVLRECENQSEVRAIPRQMAAYAKQEKRSRYQKHVLDACILALCEDRYRKELAEALGVHCPNTLGTAVMIEHVLVADNGKKLTQPLVALCDAFELATDDENKIRIVDALERAAFGYVPRDSTDATFVRNVRKWYKANVKYLKTNRFYTSAPFITGGPLDPERRLFLDNQDRVE
jgi:hypothetical protein